MNKNLYTVVALKKELHYPFRLACLKKRRSGVDVISELVKKFIEEQEK